MISFDIEPQKAIEYFRKKEVKPLAYEEKLFESYHNVFAVRGITNINILESLKSKIEDAMRKGMSVEDFCNDFIEKKTAIIPKTQLKTIFNTNVRQVYNLARYESQLQSDKPYFRYVAINDYRTRENHAKMHGLILPKSHGFWASNYPPNGFNCRCKVQALSLDEARALGYKGKFEKIEQLASDGFKDNPIKYHDKLMDILKDKANSIKGTHAKLLQRKYKTFNNDYKEQLKRFNTIKDYIKDIDKKENKDYIKMGDYMFFKKKKPLFLSKETLITHIKEHPEIKSYDYALISEIISRGKKSRIGTKEIRFTLTVGKKYYFLSIKDVSNKDEMFINTLFYKDK